MEKKEREGGGERGRRKKAKGLKWRKRKTDHLFQ